MTLALGTEVALGLDGPTKHIGAVTANAGLSSRSTGYGYWLPVMVAQLCSRFDVTQSVMYLFLTSQPAQCAAVSQDSTLPVVLWDACRVHVPQSSGCRHCMPSPPKRAKRGGRDIVEPYATPLEQAVRTS